MKGRQAFISNHDWTELAPSAFKMSSKTDNFLILWGFAFLKSFSIKYRHKKPERRRERTYNTGHLKKTKTRGQKKTRKARVEGRGKRRWTDLLAWSVQQPHRMGGASCGSGASGITGRIAAVQPAHAVEAEAVGAAVRPVEDGGRRLAGHGLAGAL